MTIIEFLASLHRISKNLRAGILHVLHIVSTHQGRELRESGEPVLEHPCSVMRQLLDLGFPLAVVLAGGLHDILEDTKVTFRTLVHEFGIEVAWMVWGVTKRPKEKFETKAERLREFHKRFLRLARRNFYIIFIKLADRLHNLETLRGLERKDPDKVRRVATETLDFYVPLARKVAKPFTPVELHPILDSYADKMELLAKSSLVRISNPTVPAPAS